VSTFPVLDDAAPVLSAVRLGWAMAETRGRNRPGGPHGVGSTLPADNNHALPLDIERTPTELRIEAQALVAALAAELKVDQRAGGASFGAALDDKAKLLDRARADSAARALQAAAGLLERRKKTGADPATAISDALQILAASHTRQEGRAANLTRAVAAAEQTLAAAQHRQEGRAAKLAQAVAAAELALHAAREAALGPGAGSAARPAAGAATGPAASGGADAAGAALDLARAARDGTERAIAALDSCAAGIRAADGLEAAAHVCASAASTLQASVAADAGRVWGDLAELIWEFDAHIQDGLAAVSESLASGYQLGRGLAETYWALDPAAPADGATGWCFLLGTDRCAELSRLAGRLGSYLNQYTAPAIAGSINVWQTVADNQAWRDNKDAQPALYTQIRRWYSLIILGQDPTTLIKPTDIIRDYRTIFRTLRWFLPELAALAVGLAALAFLIYYLTDHARTLPTVISGILSFTGLSVAGVASKLKNSEQALLTRLRQDAYTDLVAIAVQSAPRPPEPRDVRKAIAKRKLTPATPN
jgi:hypothetical protein